MMRLLALSLLLSTSVFATFIDTYTRGIQETNPTLSINSLSDAINLSTSDNALLSMAHLKRAQAYLKVGNTPNALQDYSSALAIYPKNGEALYDLYQFYIPSNNQKADYYFTKSLNANYPIAIYQLAKNSAQSDGPKAALDYAHQLLDNFETDFETKNGIVVAPTTRADYQFFRGQLYDTLTQYDLAIADYTAAMRFDSSNPAIQRSRGIAHFKAQNIASAITDLSAVVSKKPSDDVAQVWLGKAFLYDQQFDKAITHFASAASTNIKAHMLLAESYFYNKNYIKAAAEAAKLLTQTPTNSHLYLITGYAQLTSQNYTAALTTFTTGLSQLDIPAYASRDLFFYRGYAHWYLEDDKNAIADFTQAVALGHRQAKSILKDHFRINQ